MAARSHVIHLPWQNLPADIWLQEQGILPPGHKDAPSNVGHVFWKLISTVLETVRVQREEASWLTTSQPEQRVHTLSLANNGFHNLTQLSKLPLCLPYIRALDLSENPIHASDELRHLQSPGEAKGKASAAAGSLKSLVELKLVDVRFRTELLAKPDGGDKYQQ